MEVRGLDSNRQVTWCEASGGEIPPGGVIGGNDDEDLYIGRANHEGALIPGKIKPSHGVCYIAWGGKEHSKDTYEVRHESSSQGHFSWKIIGRGRERKGFRARPF